MKLLSFPYPGQNAELAYPQIQAADSTSWTTQIQRVLYPFVCTLYSAFYGREPNFGDLFLAFAPAKEMAFPGTYPASDLIISSSQHMPFHLYRLIAFLYRRNIDVPFVWECGYWVIWFLLLFTIWKLAVVITKDECIGALAVGLITVMPNTRGTLNYSLFPIGVMVTAQFVMPAIIMILIVLLRKKYFAALILSSITYNIHPYVGMIGLLLSATLTLWDQESSSFRKKIWWFLIAGMFTLPNTVFILVNLPQTYTRSVSAADQTLFKQMFWQYASHVYFDSHWRSGYGWFFLFLGATVFWTQVLKKEIKVQINRILAVLTVITGVYAVNAYTFEYRPLLLTYLFRTTYFLKPILVTVSVFGLQKWMQLREVSLFNLIKSRAFGSVLLVTLLAYLPQIVQHRVTAGVSQTFSEWEILCIVGYGVAILYAIAITLLGSWRPRPAFKFELCVLGTTAVFISFITPNIALSEMFGILGWSFCLIDFSESISVRRIAGLFALVSTVLVLLQALVPFGLATSVSEAQPYLLGMSLMLMFILLREKQEWTLVALPSYNPLKVFLSGAFIIVLSCISNFFWTKNKFTIFPMTGLPARRLIGLSEPAENLKGVVNWAKTKTPKQSLFAVPPFGFNGEVLRHLGERGVFLTSFEVCTLLFDMSVVNEVKKRMTALGVGDERPVRGEKYYELSGEDLKRLNQDFSVNYAVFDAKNISAEVYRLPHAFKDDNFVVVDLGAIRALLH